MEGRLSGRDNVFIHLLHKQKKKEEEGIISDAVFSRLYMVVRLWRGGEAFCLLLQRYHNLPDNDIAMVLCSWAGREYGLQSSGGDVILRA